MNEVELTSEFMLLIMQGILEKSQNTIDEFYEDYDAQFDDAPEIASRFRTTFEAIETLFSKDEITDLFRNKTIFYALFATVYGLQFGLRSPDKEYKEALSRRKKAKSINGHLIDHIKTAASQIKNDDVPQTVLKAARGATTHASQRRMIIRYLAGRDNDPCPAQSR